MHPLSLSFNSVIRICFLMFKMSNEYNNLCNNGVTLNCIINDCSVSRIKKCVLVLLAIPCVTLCEVCFCSLFVVLLPFHTSTCTAFMRINFIIKLKVVRKGDRHKATEIRCMRGWGRRSILVEIFPPLDWSWRRILYLHERHKRTRKAFHD